MKDDKKFKAISEHDPLSDSSMRIDNDSSSNMNNIVIIGDKIITQPYMRPRKWVIRERNRCKFYFDILIIIFASFNSFSIPFAIAFKPDSLDHAGYIAANWIINGFFIFDIIISFRTTYMNTKSGDEIYDPIMIAKHYILGGRFWVDILSAVPFDEFTTNEGIKNILSLIGLLKIVRVSRLGRII